MGMYGRKSVVIKCGQARTKQSFKDECNIHTIMDKYHRTGLVTHLNATRPMYGDFSSVPDYQSALNVVINARNEFAKLPASLRDRFMNDPVKLLAFVNDPQNREEAVKLGILRAEKSESVASGDSAAKGPEKAAEGAKVDAAG